MTGDWTRVLLRHRLHHYRHQQSSSSPPPVSRAPSSHGSNREGPSASSVPRRLGRNRNKWGPYSARTSNSLAHNTAPTGRDEDEEPQKMGVRRGRNIPKLFGRLCG